MEKANRSTMLNILCRLCVPSRSGIRQCSTFFLTDNYCIPASKQASQLTRHVGVGCFVELLFSNLSTAVSKYSTAVK
jgi:hypothetical protein